MGQFKLRFSLSCVVLVFMAVADTSAYYTSFSRTRAEPRADPCASGTGSCFPQSGNLLIGREARLTASSTCGMKGEEEYCVVSYPGGPKKCYQCDSTQSHLNEAGLSHRISNVVYQNFPGTQQRTWWQSQNGLNNVFIQLDLETEFQLTHMILHFKTLRPAAMLIERSSDGGRTWKVYQYFAYDCATAFPGIPTQKTSINEAFCESRYSGVMPASQGEIIFRVVPKPFMVTDQNVKEIQDLSKITNLRINFTRLHTLGEDRIDPTTADKYYYAINEVVARGSCSCNGHATRCTPLGSSMDYTADMVHGQCECQHNTKGIHCEECADGFYLKPGRSIQDFDACERRESVFQDSPSSVAVFKQLQKGFSSWAHQIWNFIA